MRLRGLGAFLVVLSFAQASLTSKMKTSIERWDKKAYLSLFADPSLSDLQEVFRFKPTRVNVSQRDNLLTLAILRKPFPLIQVWRIKEEGGKIVEKEVLYSIRANAYYGEEDCRCYLLKKARIDLPDLKAEFSGGRLCQWPDIFLFVGKGKFSFSPSEPAESKALTYEVGEGSLQEQISFLALRIQHKPGASVNFTIGPEVPLGKRERMLFGKYLKEFGLFYSPLLEAEVLPPVPRSGAVVLLGGSRVYKYIYDPSSEREIYFSDLKAKKYISLYSPPGKVMIILRAPSPRFVKINGKVDGETNKIEARAEYSFPRPIKRKLYFYLAPGLEIERAEDEKGFPLVFQRGSGGAYEIYPNGSFTKIKIEYRGSVEPIESYSSLAGGYFYPTSWYPNFGGFYRYSVNLKCRGADLVVPGERGRDGYYSRVPVPYIGLGLGRFKNRYSWGNLEVYLEKRRLKEAYMVKNAFQKTEKLLGPLPWGLKIIVAQGLFYFGASSPGIVMLRVLPIDKNIYAPGPMPCGKKYLIYHEMVHQWIGGLVSPRTFSDYWINEGLTSLLAGMLSCKKFEEKFRKTFIKDVNLPPLVMGGRIGYYRSSIGDVFSHLHYRSALVLNMARLALGDEEFLKAVKEFLSENLYSEYSWDKFTSLLEEKMGRPGFFLPWVQTDFIPEFTYSYRNGLLTIRERKALRIGDREVHFQVPVPIRSGNHRVILWVKKEGSRKVSPDFRIEGKLLPAKFYRARE